MANNIKNDALDYLRESSDKIVEAKILNLKTLISALLEDFGCAPLAEGESGWFSAEGRAILKQLAELDPSSGWPFWIWNQEHNKILASIQAEVSQEISQETLAKREVCVSPVSYELVEIDVTVGSGDSEREFSVVAKRGESLGGSHVVLIKYTLKSEAGSEDLSDDEWKVVEAAVLDATVDP